MNKKYKISESYKDKEEDKFEKDEILVCVIFFINAIISFSYFFHIFETNFPDFFICLFYVAIEAVLLTIYFTIKWIYID